MPRRTAAPWWIICSIVTGTVESFIGAQAANTVGVLTDVDVAGATNVTADGTMKAIALANGLGASLTAAINIMLPTATDSGRTAAYVRDGVKLAAGSLQVQAGQRAVPLEAGLDVGHLTAGVR